MRKIVELSNGVVAVINYGVWAKKEPKEGDTEFERVGVVDSITFLEDSYESVAFVMMADDVIKLQKALLEIQSIKEVLPIEQYSW